MAEKKEKRTSRYTDDEMRLIKGLFMGNDDMIVATRKHFLGEELSEAEKQLLKLISEESAIKVIEKAFIPTVDSSAPIHTVIDMWTIIHNDIKDKIPEMARHTLLARMTVIKYLEQRIEALRGSVPLEPITLDSLLPSLDKDIEKCHAEVIARSEIIIHIERQLSFFVVISGKEDETPEQTMERLRKESSK